MSNSCYCRYLPIFADIGVAPNVAPIVRNCLRHFQKVLKNMLTMFDNRCIL
nr:MAG TPA: hypothetical protein [Caudoviricetes sp.]